MDKIEAERLAGAVNRIRPDFHFGSVMKFLERPTVMERGYLDFAVAMLACVIRPETETPARVLEAGPWWEAAARNAGHQPGDRRPTPSSIEELCWCGKPYERYHGDDAPWGHPFEPEGYRRPAAPVADPAPEYQKARAALAHSRD